MDADRPAAPLSGIHNRMTIPFFKKRGKPSPVSASDVNLLVRILRALVNPTVIVQGNKWDLQITDTNLVFIVPTYASSTGGGGNMNYRGTYSNASTYNYGDVVRVRSGSGQGVWVCVSSTAVIGTAPVFPEPADSGGTNTWELLGPPVAQFTGCAGGAATTFYIGMFS